MTPEGKIKHASLKFLKQRGIYCWNNPTGAVKIRGEWFHFGKAGSSDILGILPGGRMLCVEVKTRQGRVSPEQREFLNTIKKHGGLACVVHSVSELAEVLRREGIIDKGELIFRYP